MVLLSGSLTVVRSSNLGVYFLEISGLEFICFAFLIQSINKLVVDSFLIVQVVHLIRNITRLRLIVRFHLISQKISLVNSFKGKSEKYPSFSNSG